VSARAGEPYSTSGSRYRDRMSIHLVGGGWSSAHETEIFGGFLLEAAERAERSGRVVPRFALVFVGDEASIDYQAQYLEALARVAPCEPVVEFVRIGQTLPSTSLTDIDGIFVAGGLTPAYLAAFEPRMDELRLLVADGLPYLGFSAGAAIAADTAIIGGWLLAGVPVCDEDFAEGLVDVTVAQGLGFVDLAIDVHAAQWGTLTRLIAATEAGLVQGGIAIDEATVLVVGDGELTVRGRGNVWQVSDGTDGVVVATIG